MKGLDSGPSPSMGELGAGEAPCSQGPGDNFPACLAEAIDILADRARRHGLVEVVHLLEVAALAARDVAAAPVNGHNQTKRSRSRARPSPA